MKKELPKAYEPKNYEDAIYKKWEESGLFRPEAGQPLVDNPDNLGLEKGDDYFSVSMPPPNVTGVLHLGHALENSIMDIEVRFQRLRGKKTLLVPGTDHAAVATQAKVEKVLLAKGIKNPREEFGREGLLEKIREYAEDSKATILKQIRKLGTSADWSRLAYTFDDDRCRAVNEVFVRMYKDGLIYKGYRTINWSVKGQSTCSDDELEYRDEKTKLYTFKYAKNFPISIATTRPETKLGDTAVAVNPNDDRYKEYIGKVYTVEVGAKKPLEIKIIADEAIDMAYGTGAIGVTPAHSMVDFEMYERHKLELIQVIGADGKMTESAGSEYAGLSLMEAREKFVTWLRDNSLLEKEEEIDHNVATSDRFGDVVEVIPMEQWFVDVNKKIPGREKSLKELMREAVTIGHNGDKNKKIIIVPDRFNNQYFHWIDNLRDWCISRQIWWGHRIPVWYRTEVGSEMEAMHFNESVLCEKLGLKDERDFDRFSTDILQKHLWREKNIQWGSNKDGVLQLYIGYINLLKKMGFLDDVWIEENRIKKQQKEADIYVGVKPPSEIGWYQDDDTLDTWFSSGLWTFSTLGWPEQTADFKTYHPTSWMQMGYEILFFWMARMILMSTYALDDIPFKNVYIHGILRDKEGRKFSKSLGNGIDPIEVIEKYGADALRLSLVIGIAPGNDSRFYEEKVESARNFVNKLWNISRFIIGNQELGAGNLDLANLTLADKWILAKMKNLILETTNDLENYNFSQAGERLREFTRDDLADWYLETSKFEKNPEKEIILNLILKDLLKLLHPFIPFVTEAIWGNIDETPLIIAKWPTTEKYEINADNNFELIKEIISAIRNARSENQVEPAKKIKAVIYTGDKFDLIKSQEVLIKGLRTGIEDLEIKVSGEKVADAIYAVAGGVEIYLIGAVDTEKEKARIAKEIVNLEKVIKNLETKLSNQEFIDRAPAEIVEKEKEKLKGYQEELVKLKEQIENL